MWRRWSRAKEESTAAGTSECKDSSDEQKPLERKVLRRKMTKKPSPTKTRTGNALAQFVIISALTVVAYQFIVTRLYAASTIEDVASVLSNGDPLPAGRTSPSPWTDAALDKHRARREAISTTEFSCFMACIGLFGLMQRKKKRSEEQALEAQRRHVGKKVLREKRGGQRAFVRSSSDETESPLVSPRSSPERHHRSTDLVAILPVDVQLELFTFLPREDLVACAMVSKSWHLATGDSSDQLWREVFLRDFKESGERFDGVLPRICWRQYYFLHHLSRAVEIARLLDVTEDRKCVVIEGLVYDVTSFLDAHPGGYHVIGDVLGTDASELWDQFQHSAEAKELMKQFVVFDEILDARKRDGTREVKTLASVMNRWQQISWCLAHAHLFGGLSSTFVDISFKFIVWRTTKRQPCIIQGC